MSNWPLDIAFIITVTSMTLLTIKLYKESNKGTSKTVSEEKKAYVVNDDVFTKNRYNQILKSVKENDRVLNLGDNNDSLLTKALRAMNCSVTTVDYRVGADIQLDMEGGLPLVGEFDTVIAGELFEHIYNLKELLRGVRLNLGRKGKLIVSVPNVCNLRSRVRVLIGLLPSYAADADTYHEVTGYPGHVRDFNKEAITRLLESEGFEIITTRNTGLAFRMKPLIPYWLCRDEWSDNLIIEAKRKEADSK